MKLRPILWLTACAALLAVCSSCSKGTSAIKAAIGEPDITKIGPKPGDPAPRLQPSGWVQGDPVKQIEPGKAYLVEFWATYCPPCLESIPHLSELHTKYKDKGLIIIGTDAGEDSKRVEEFVKKMSDKMTYRVALDENMTMTTNWLSGSDETPIPFAFLVDTQGRIAWKGFPLDLNPQTIEKVLPGKS